MACDLREVELFKDEGGELITSLVLEDKPRPPVELERIEEAGNKTENHAALWSCIRSRTQRGDKCTKGPDKGRVITNVLLDDDADSWLPAATGINDRT